MNRSALALTLEQILHFLHRDGPFLMTSEARDSFAQKAQALLRKAHQQREALYVGILGGTGVGKSTLINALAKSRISDASDKRPFTNRAVVYRHKSTPRGLDEISSLIREDDALHDSNVIKDLVLMDLPDFDSVEQDNLKAVHEILPFLDCVVWVVSPEKYADSVLYHLVGQTRINRRNFTFVFNKADELIEHGKGDPNSKLKEALGDFTFRLKHESGIEQPKVFTVSALDEVDGKKDQPVLESEFNRFRGFLMIRRDAKEISSVKTVNLEEETRHLLKELDVVISPEKKKRLLSGLPEILITPSPESSLSEFRLVDHEKRLAGELSCLLLSEDTSIGPVRLALRVLNWGRAGVAKPLDDDLDSIFLRTARAVGKNRRQEFEALDARLGSELLLAFRQTEAYRSGEEPEETLNKAVNQASQLLAQKINRSKGSRAVGLSGWRRFFQRLVLGIPMLILIARLAGPPAVEAWLEHPSLSGGLKIAVGFLTSLFSSDGLTGLLVLLICELFLIFYLASKRMKKIEKDARNFAAAAIKNLNDTLEASARRAREEKRETLQRIQEGIDRLTALGSMFDTAVSDRPDDLT
ncbi:MAG: GTPase [Desulfomonilaceae bacterium]